MAVNKTSLSAGEIIRAVLLEDPEVSARTRNIYPIVQTTEAAVLPYIAYRRAEMAVNPQNSGQPGADLIKMEVTCYTAKYAEGVELAEAVRGALDYVRAEQGGAIMRGCYLAESQEDYQNDAFIQQLVFNIKI